jgi:hypothetical protein
MKGRYERRTLPQRDEHEAVIPLNRVAIADDQLDVAAGYDPCVCGDI